LISHLAHDLRTPLTAIRGAATLLRESRHELPPDRVGVLLAIIESQAEQMANRVEDLLVASRLEGGRLRLFDEDADLGPIVATEIDSARRAAPGRRIRATGVVDGVRVHADSERVAQLLRILLENAVRYSPAEQWIEVRAGTSVAAVRIEVRDRGVGIPAAQRARIFDRFQRYDTGGQGSGLGLYVARGLARAMGGDCGFDARRAGGSVFWFTLPHAEKK